MIRSLLSTLDTIHVAPIGLGMTQKLFFVNAIQGGAFSLNDPLNYSLCIRNHQRDDPRSTTLPSVFNPPIDQLALRTFEISYISFQDGKLS